MLTIPGAPFSTGLDSLVLGTEQTNTSLVYGDESILKVFRRLPRAQPGPRGEHRARRLGSPHVAEPFGWVEARLEGVPTILAILSRFLRLASDGWSLAATSVRDLYALATARVTACGPARRAATSPARLPARRRHRPGACRPEHAFGADVLADDRARDLTEQMFRKLDLAVSAVPELARYAEMIGDAYSPRQAARPVPGAARARRLPPGPGNAHDGNRLGGARLRGRAGHPARAAPRPFLPAARRGRDAPFLRLRGQAPAHRPPGAVQPQRGRRRLGAAKRERFCAGYADAGGQDPDENDVLLRRCSWTRPCTKCCTRQGTGRPGCRFRLTHLRSSR